MEWKPNDVGSLLRNIQLNLDWVYFNFLKRSEKKDRRSCKKET